MRNQLKQKLAQTQQRLTAAEQRNADLMQIIGNAFERLVCITPRNQPSWFLKQQAMDILQSAALKPTESGAYQSREIGESDWVDCSKEEYDHCGKDPHMDTRIKPTESGASE